MSTLLNTLYNITEIPVSAYEPNKNNFPLESPVNVTFTIQADDFDIKDVHSVYWHFGDPFAPNSQDISQTIKYDLSGTSHNYTQNGIYEVNCIINASTYTVHLKRKVVISSYNVNIYCELSYFDIETTEDSYSVQLKCLDPLALIYYKKISDQEWTQYTEPVTGSSEEEYLLYQAFFSDGTNTIVYAQPISLKIAVELLDIFEPSASASIADNYGNIDTVYTAYTSAGDNLYSSASSAENNNIYLDTATKIRFVNTSVSGLSDMLYSNIQIKYRLESGGGVDMFDYTDHIIIKETDTLYWQIVYQSTIGMIYGNINIIHFVIDKGIDKDIIGLNQHIYTVYE